MIAPTVTMRARPRSLAPVRRWRLSARTFGVVVVLAGVALASPAHAAWTVPGPGSSTTTATTLATPAAPGASVSSGDATVVWSASRIAGTTVDASGHVVERIWRGSGPGPQGEAAGQVGPAAGSCVGTVEGLTCTTPHASGETWAYRISPRFAAWSGGPSAESDAIRMPFAPEVTDIALIDVGTAGTVEEGDRIVVTFSEVLDATSICAGFSSDSTGVQTATGMTFIFAGNENVVTISAVGTCGASGFGQIQVGAKGNGRYTATGAGGNSFAVPDSGLSWDPVARAITITFGAVDGLTSDGASAIATYTPGALSAGGLAIAATPVDSTTEQRF